jgi:hypothetical protein
MQSEVLVQEGQHLANKVMAEDLLMMQEQLGRWAPSIYPATAGLTPLRNY